MKKSTALLVFLLLPLHGFSENIELKLKKPTFDRLFTYSESREALDLGLDEDPNRALSPQASANSPIEQHNNKNVIKIMGFIQGEKGDAKIWLNDGKNTRSNEDSADTVLKPSKSSNRLVVKSEDQLRILEPGQTWLLDEEVIKENYEVDITTPIPQAQNTNMALNDSSIEDTNLINKAQQIKELQQVIDSPLQQLEAAN